MSELAGIQLEVSDGASVHTVAALDPSLPRFVVFSGRYVRSNLRRAFEDGAGGAALYLVGDPQIELEKEIAANSALLESLTAEHKEASRNNKECAERRKTIEGTVKRQVSDELIGPFPVEYNPTRFTVAKARALLEGDRKALDASALQEHRANLQLKRENIPHDLEFSVPALPSSLKRAATDAAEHDVTSKALADLVREPNAEQWVESGLELHDAEAPCRFCGNDVSQARMNELRLHFDVSFTELRSKLATLTNQGSTCRTIAAGIGALRENVANISTELSAVMKANEAALNEFHQLFEGWMVAVEALVSEREKSPHAPFTFAPPAEPNTAAWEAVSAAVRSHNRTLAQRRVSLDAIKTTSKAALLRHFASVHGEAFDRAVAEEAATQGAVDGVASKLSTARATMEKLRAKRQSKHDGETLARKLSTDLAAYLGHGELEVQFEVEPETQGFRFRRNGGAAKDLSEGERNAIALLHFLRSLESLSVPGDLSDYCVVVDDPVSSLDHDAILSAFSFIKSRLCDEDGGLLCGQLLVLTHNFEFFRLWKDSMKGQLAADAKEAKKRECALHELHRRRASVSELLVRSEMLDGGMRRVPVLRDFGAGLRALTSEYYYLFARACESTHADGEELLPLTGNSTRRLLESFVRFKSPNLTTFTDAAMTLGRDNGVDAAITMTVVKALHGASHRDEIDIRSATHRSGIVREISAALGFIQAVDENHFVGMCEATENAPRSLEV